MPDRQGAEEREVEVRMREEDQPARPWCCPEPRCQPIHQLANGPLDEPSPGESFMCFGRGHATFAYDYPDEKGDHVNDLRSCSYTPAKGLIANFDNEDDWAMLSRAFATALKKLRAALHPTKEEGPDG